MRNLFVFLMMNVFLGQSACMAQSPKANDTFPNPFPENYIATGAENTEAYLPLLANKKVAMLINQTSQINGVLLPDTLLKLGVNIVKIFSPEHGFRGLADAGAKVKDGVDSATGIPVISLYGKNKKPTADQLKGVDIVIYDLQDVGVRFYTYISSLEYLIEACSEQKKELIVLDRPNPLGNIVDGPVLEKTQKSFVGMQPIPVVYGMTVGEYAKMIIGEKWVSTKNLKFTVIPCSNYTHDAIYELPVPPSPNLKNMTAVYLYPSLCFFEGTVISLGRGTEFPFQQYGHPSFAEKYDSTFTPKSVTGATNPPLKDELCYGEIIATTPQEALDAIAGKLQIKWLIAAYRNFDDKDNFFLKNNFINKLAGNTLLQQQIIDDISEDAIRASWKKDLEAFKKIRAKYLLYD